jgi:hypothetical protein
MALDSRCLSFGNRGIANMAKTIKMTPERRTEYMRSSPLAAVRERRLGQQATFTDGYRVFELNVRNREAHQALPGQNRKLTG